jgi:ribA/ribD-fused uncharacterized protein
MKPTIINHFAGEYRWLSNFWPVPIVLDDMLFPTVEHAYQAAKTTNMHARKEILIASSPGLAKRLGRIVPMRKDWHMLKEGVMLLLLRQKFAYPELREKLRATGDLVLVEGNTWGDTYWGADMRTGVGCNKLGVLLMHVRSEVNDANRT